MRSVDVKRVIWMLKIKFVMMGNLVSMKSVWCLFAVLILMAGAGQAQVREVYIKLDETVSISARSSAKLLSIGEINNRPEVLSLQSIQPKSTSASGRSVAKESKYLKGIYKIEISGEDDAFIKEMATYSNVIAVEEVPDFQVLLVPNDEMVAEQGYLEVIGAYDAWDVAIGADNLLIGISDTGFDLDHEDLTDNLYINEGDPINGIDDDNNGYVDDYQGWDVADNDNNASFHTHADRAHGTSVAGMAAATANNGIGVAGLSYNSRYLPIKIAQSSNGSFRNAYESIVYAADMGCDVVNLSWGGTGNFSSIAQDIINYAAIEKNMVVVAAAGNTDAELDFYPASYRHVLSVGKSTVTDAKASNATWSYHIDLMAPGQAVLTTTLEDQYEAATGSSFSAPLVAAAAALVKAKFPAFNALQIMEQIRMTSDDIYEVGSNMEYYGMLGKGRLNVFRAVTETNLASVRSYNHSVTYPYGTGAFAEDTVVVTMDFQNIMRATQEAKVEIVSESEFVEVLNDEIVLGSLYSSEVIEGVKVSLLINEGVKTNERLTFRMNYSDAKGHDDFQYFYIYSGPDAVQLSNNRIEQTIASNGNLAYGEDVYEGGSGLRYDGLQAAGMMGIAVGNHPDSISDNFVSLYEGAIRSQDFQSVRTLKPTHRDDIDQYVRGVFSDSLAEQVQGLLIEQEMLLWDDEENENFIIQEYYLTNTTSQDREQMYFGYYADFNVGNLNKNFSLWDSTAALGYTFSEVEGSLMVGMKLLSGQNPIFHAVDLLDENEEYLEMAETLTDSMKYEWLTVAKDSAGGENGLMVAQVLAADLGTIPALSSSKVAYALVFGYFLDELKLNADRAQLKYDEFLLHPDVNRTRFVCEDTEFGLANEDYLKVYKDPLGNELLDEGANLNFAGFSSDTSFFYQKVVDGYSTDIYEMYFQIFNPKVEFRADPSIFFIGEEGDQVQFIDQSLTSVSWDWDFGNGFYSKAKNPYTKFSEVGDYAISLAINTELGCESQGELIYQVRERGTAPVLEDQEICAGESVRVAAQNTSAIKVYDSEEGGTLMFEGEEWDSPVLNESAVYYVSSMADEYESLRIPVYINVDPVSAAFEVQPDTTDLSAGELLMAINRSEGESSVEWTINEVAIGASEVVVVDVSQMESASVKLKAISMAGCVSERSEEVEFQTSIQPGINSATNREACYGEFVYSEPLYGEYFAFYADPGLETLIAKGSSASLGPVFSDTSFYITNISDFHESEAVELDIDLKAFDVELLAEPAALIYGESTTALFTLDEHSQVASYKWYVDGILVEIDDTLNYSFFELGEYDLDLVVGSTEGCIDTLSMIYKVYEPEVPLEAGQDQNLNLFPNPASTNYYIEGLGLEVESIKVFTILGQVEAVSAKRLDAEMIVLDISHLRSGAYFIVLYQNDKEVFRKFIKQ